jgi:hypothetical protein
MPKRADQKAALTLGQGTSALGAGPIVIGQARRFDHSATQGLAAFREDFYA